MDPQCRCINCLFTLWWQRRCVESREEQKLGKQAGLALLFATGMGVLFATATPQTPEEVRKYLEKDGYSNVVVQSLQGRCGKGQLKFSFKARNSQNRPTSGEVCGYPYPALYRVSINR
jgi:hypothetical protein